MIDKRFHILHSTTNFLGTWEFQRPNDLLGCVGYDTHYKWGFYNYYFDTDSTIWNDTYLKIIQEIDKINFKKFNI